MQIALTSYYPEFSDDPNFDFSDTDIGFQIYQNMGNGAGVGSLRVAYAPVSQTGDMWVSGFIGFPFVTNSSWVDYTQIEPTSMPTATATPLSSADIEISVEIDDTIPPPLVNRTSKYLISITNHSQTSVTVNKVIFTWANEDQITFVISDPDRTLTGDSPPPVEWSSGTYPKVLAVDETIILKVELLVNQSGAIETTGNTRTSQDTIPNPMRSYTLEQGILTS